MKARILLTGRDLEPLRDLPNQLTGTDHDWEVAFARSGAEALGWIDQYPFDAVVADVALPDMTGSQLLDLIQRRNSSVLRFAYAPVGTDPSQVKAVVGTSHHLLAKPCTISTLRSALLRAFSFRSYLPTEAVQNLVSNMHMLPSPPAIYFEVVRELQSPNSSLENIGRLISRDPAMTAKLLQLANSAAFGLAQQVTDASTAVMYLGAEMTKTLILMAHTFSYFDQLKFSAFSVDFLWQHSLMVAKHARWICEHEDQPGAVAAKAYTAGLLHDLGKLALAANLPKPFSLAMEMAHNKKLPMWQIEQEVFGANHAQVGGALLGIWGLPSDVVESVAYHHNPNLNKQPGFTMLTAVHVGNCLAHESEPEAKAGIKSEIEQSYLESVEMANRLDGWREHCKWQLSNAM